MRRDDSHHGNAQGEDRAPEGSTRSIGKRTLTEAIASAVQRKPVSVAETAAAPVTVAAAPALLDDPFGLHVLAAPVQHASRELSGAQDEEVHAAARHGTAGPGGELPHADAIQRSFGKHDVSEIRSHTDGAAAEATAAMGAQAFASGADVAFAPGATDLHTAAHEAAHVVQQRAGVQLLGGVGEAGDVYERHADAVADRVVRGESSEELLDAHAGGAGGPAVQRLPSAFKARLGAEPLLRLTPLQAVTQSTWNAYIIQIKQYFDVDDDDDRRQRIAFTATYRAKGLYDAYRDELKQPQRDLVEQVIHPMLETERQRLFGGSGVDLTDLAAGPVNVPDDALTPKPGHGGFASKFDREDRMSAPLFDGPPTIDQVQQGNLGDCYLLAAVASLVSTRPQHFFDHILDRMDGRVTVKLYQDDGSPVNITVEKSTLARGGATGSLWIAVLEKAYVAAGFHGNPGVVAGGAYANIEAGTASVALRHLTGKASGGLAIGQERAGVAAAVTDQLRARQDQIRDQLRELGAVMDAKAQRHESTAAEQAQFEQLMLQLNEMQEPTGELFAKLSLHYVSRDVIQAFLTRHADKPALVAAVKQATAFDAAVGVLPGELGSGRYGRDEATLFERIRTRLDAGAAVTACTKNALEDADNQAEAERGNAGETKVSGLAAKHEYSVLDYKPKPPRPGEPILVQLRNPWGNYGRKYVEQHGQKRGVAVHGGDGVFWLDLADMVSFFESLTFLLD